VTRSSSAPLVLAIHLFAIFLMLSCGSARPPKQILVRAQPDYSGTVHLDVCVKNSPADDISLDAQGIGTTSLCPSADERIQITVIRGSQAITIAPPDVHVSRTGDGIATSVETNLRP